MLSISLALSAKAQPAPLSDAASADASSYVIVARGADSQLLQRVTWTTNVDNKVIGATNFVTQIETGLNYWDPNSGEWLPSEEVIELLPGDTGAVARKAPPSGRLPAQPLRRRHPIDHA